MKIYPSAFALLTAAVFSCSCGGNHIEEAGGAYAASPDGRWLAEISDGHSKLHGKPFGVVRLWDLAMYPSLTNGIRSYSGKSPTVRFEFPQSFHARDAKCDVSWQSNSTVFVIEFVGASGSVTQSNTSLRRLRYDLKADLFSLDPAPPH